MSTIEGAAARRGMSTPALGALGLVGAAVIIFAGNYHVKAGENGGTGPAILTAAICLVLAAGLFGYVVPRAGNLDRTALILGVLAVISVVVFWSGVTPILAAAAFAVTGRGLGAPSGKVKVVLALAVLVSLVAVVASIVG